MKTINKANKYKQQQTQPGLGRSLSTLYIALYTRVVTIQHFLVLCFYLYEDFEQLNHSIFTLLRKVTSGSYWVGSSGFKGSQDSRDFCLKTTNQHLKE